MDGGPTFDRMTRTFTTRPTCANRWQAHIASYRPARSGSTRTLTRFCWVSCLPTPPARPSPRTRRKSSGAASALNTMPRGVSIIATATRTWRADSTPRRRTSRDSADLYLHGGSWNGAQVVPAAWVAASVGVDTSRHEPEISTWWQMQHTLYWWHPIQPPAGEFFADGSHGQRIYVDPATETIIVQLANDSHQDFPFRKIVAYLNGKPWEYPRLDSRASSTRRRRILAPTRSARCFGDSWMTERCIPEKYTITENAMNTVGSPAGEAARRHSRPDSRFTKSSRSSIRDRRAAFSVWPTPMSELETPSRQPKHGSAPPRSSVHRSAICHPDASPTSLRQGNPERRTCFRSHHPAFPSTAPPQRNHRQPAADCRQRDHPPDPRSAPPRRPPKPARGTRDAVSAVDAIIGGTVSPAPPSAPSSTISAHTAS